MAISSCSGNPFMSNLFSTVDAYELPSSFGSAGVTSYLIENAVDELGAPMSEEDAIEAIAAAIVDPTNKDFPNTSVNPSVDDAENPEDLIEAMLGPGLAEVVDAGFDMGALEDLGV